MKTVRTQTAHARLVALPALVLLLAGCGGGGGETVAAPAPVTPAPAAPAPATTPPAPAAAPPAPVLPSAPPTSTQPYGEIAFLEYVHGMEYGDKDFATASDETLLSIGKAVCPLLRGLPYDQVVQGMMTSGGSPTEAQARVFVNQAQRKLCE